MLRFIRNNLIVLQIILIMPVIFVGFYLQLFITFDLRTSGFAKYVLIDYPEIGNILRCVAFLILPIVFTIFEVILTIRLFQNKDLFGYETIKKRNLLIYEIVMLALMSVAEYCINKVLWIDTFDGGKVPIVPSYMDIVHSSLSIIFFLLIAIYFVCYFVDKNSVFFTIIMLISIVYVAIYYIFPRFNVTYTKILLIISIPFLVLDMCLIWIRKLYLSILIK